MVIEPGEGGDHGGEDTGKKDGNLGGGMEIEPVDAVNGLGSGEPRADGGGEHQQFAEKGRVINEDGAENDGQKEEVGEALEFPAFLRMIQGGFDGWGREVSFQKIKDEEQETDGGEPGGPAILEHPPEGDAFQEAKEQGRVA